MPAADLHQDLQSLQRPLQATRPCRTVPGRRAEVDPHPAVQHRQRAEMIRGDYVNVSVTLDLTLAPSTTRF